MYNNIGLEPEHTAWSYALVIWNSGKWNSVKWNETRPVGAIFASFWVARVCQRQLGLLVLFYMQTKNVLLWTLIQTPAPAIRFSNSTYGVSSDVSLIRQWQLISLNLLCDTYASTTRIPIGPTLEAWYLASNKTRPRRLCDTRPSRIITDHRLSQKRGISLMILYSTMCRMGRRSSWSWFDLNRSTFDEDAREKVNDFCIFVPSDLDLWPTVVKFAPLRPLVTFVQGDVSTKLEVSTAFLFPENRRHATDRRTDGRRAKMRPPRKGCTFYHVPIESERKVCCVF